VDERLRQREEQDASLLKTLCTVVEGMEGALDKLDQKLRQARTEYETRACQLEAMIAQMIEVLHTEASAIGRIKRINALMN